MFNDQEKALILSLLNQLTIPALQDNGEIIISIAKSIVQKLEKETKDDN